MTTTIAKTTRTARTKRATTSASPTSALRLSVGQAALKRALALVSQAVAARSPLPVLGNVLLASDGPGRLRLSATDLQLGLSVTLDAQVEREGALTLPAKLLADVVGSLPDDTISLEVDARTQAATLRCARFEATIKGIDAAEFPALPAIAGCPAVTFQPEALRGAIEQVAFAASGDEVRPVLTAVRLALREAVASFAAADGFRLAFRDLALDAPVAAPQELLIPARALRVLGRVLGEGVGEVELRIAADGSQAAFRTEGLELIARLLDGRYPDIERYLSLRPTTRLEIATAALARAVRLAAYFAVASSNIVRLTLAPAEEGAGTLTIAANAAEVGDNHSVHDATIAGAGAQVALNVAFLAEGIAAISTPTLALALTSPRDPVVLMGVGDEAYRYIMMPMTVQPAA